MEPFISEYQNHFVYGFPNGEREQVQFSIREYNQRFYLDVRIWYRNNPSTPFVPTRKGLSIKPYQVKDLQKGLAELSQAVWKMKKERPQESNQVQPGFHEQTPRTQAN